MTHKLFIYIAYFLLEGLYYHRMTTLYVKVYVFISHLAFVFDVYTVVSYFPIASKRRCIPFAHLVYDTCICINQQHLFLYHYVWTSLMPL